MALLFTAPQLAYRDCEHCRQWQYDEQTGEPLEAGGELRPRFLPVLCAKGRCPKLGPDGIRRDLTLRNWRAWVHFEECRAVGQFPDDPIVRRNARIISVAESNGRAEAASNARARR